MTPSPRILIAVTATGTEVGKTWTIAATAGALRAAGRTVSARKPAQSFSPSERGTTDADVLASSTGEEPTAVCPEHRWYPIPLAPPMAATELGMGSFTISELAAELAWPTACEICFVEGAGGLRSPLADDGDNLSYFNRIAPQLTVIVSDAGLGTINNIRLAVDALGERPTVVFLNRFTSADSTHRLNRRWLIERDRLRVAASIEELVTQITAYADGA